MYVADDLKRLNDDAVARQTAVVDQGEERCEYCDKHAAYVLPVYNPADAVREGNGPVKGAYCTLTLCEECHDNSKHLDDGEYFNCAECGELFIHNHSWDVLSVTTDDGLLCQKCAAEGLEPEYWGEVKDRLLALDTEGWLRINNLPGKEKVWEGEYSDYSDFPGHTSMESVVASIEGEGVTDGDLVYTVVTQGYQFSVVIAIFR